MTESNFNMERFSHGIFIKTDSENLFRYIATPAGISKWFIGSAEYFYRQKNIRLGDELTGKGDSYLWKWLNKDLELKGIITDFEKEKMIEFTFSPLYLVRMELFPIGNRVKIVLTQSYQKSSLRNDFNFVNCCTCWVFFLTNLKSVIECNVDLREKEIRDDLLINW